MALRSYVGGGAAPLGPLFEDSSNLSDVLQRDELARVALSAGDVTTDELDALVTELDRRPRCPRRQARAGRPSWPTASSPSRPATEQLDEGLRGGHGRRRGQARRAHRSRRRSAVRRRRVAASGTHRPQAAAAQAAARRCSRGERWRRQRRRQPPANGGSARRLGGDSTRRRSGRGSASGWRGPARPRRRRRRRRRHARASRDQRGAWASSACRTGSPPVDPGVAFDCSGLTTYAWGQAGVCLPHQSRASSTPSMPHVARTEAQPGDLIFYYSPISHVGIYLGGGIDDPRPEHRHVGQGRRRQLGQGRRRRPARLTAGRRP